MSLNANNLIKFENGTIKYGKYYGDIILKDSYCEEWDWKDYSIHNTPALSLIQIKAYCGDFTKTIIIGNGSQNNLNVNKEIILDLQKQGYRVECLPTTKAVELYNSMTNEGKTGILAFIYSQ